jgi:hypothetical protein
VEKLGTASPPFDTSLGVASTSLYSISANLGAGPHTITARATDSNGASTTSAAVTFTVDGGGTGGTKIEDPIPQKIGKGEITIDLQLIADGFTSPLGIAAPDVFLSPRNHAIAKILSF